MVFYELKKVEFSGGIGEKTYETLIGNFSEKDKAITAARKCAETEEDIVLYYPKEVSSRGWLGKCFTLSGKETNYPYSGYVIEEKEMI